MKKQLLLTIVALIATNAHAMDQMEISKRKYIVYSHGFGESGEGKIDFRSLGSNITAPVYPDAPGNLSQAVFYTKPAVHTLANHLHEIAQKEDCKGIVLVGRSCGAGTAINCLAKLVHYDANKEYFEGSKIRSQEDAHNIMLAINNGAVINTVPFLSLRKANAIAIPSSVAVAVTGSAVTTIALCSDPTSCESIDPEILQTTSYALPAVFYAFRDRLKNMYAGSIVSSVVPSLTNDNFDPSHPDPLESVELLRGKLHCPILLQVSKYDGVLENPDNDTIKMYDALKNDKTHIIITEEGSHNEFPQEFFVELEDFKNRYLNEVSRVGIAPSTTQPTVDELRRIIYPWSIKSLSSCQK